MFKDKRPVKILVIEDNPGDFTLIQDYLQEQFANPEIKHARTFAGAKALLTVHEAHYEVILLDLSLSDRSGESLIAEVTSLGWDSVVIVLTGFSDMSFSVKSIALGAADYLMKDDINATTLYKSIIYNIERKKMNQQLTESEKRFSNLFQMSPQPMWVYDPVTLMIVQVNIAAINKYGYSEAEFLNLSIMDIRPEEDIPKVRTLIESRDHLSLNLTANRFRHRKKSQEIIDVEIYSSPIVLQDKAYRSVIAIDVTEKILVDHKITKAIIKTQEDERYEIGSELHDNVCQLLATSQMLLGMLKNSIDPAGTRLFDQCKQYISMALNDIRNVSHRLAPAFHEESTMEEALRNLIRNSNPGNNHKIAMKFSELVNKSRLGRELQLNLYRILQEQLRNINKYANAQSITIDVDIEEQNLIMKIIDDGVGFDISEVKAGIGLSNMKRRAELFAGKMNIDSSPGEGCKITVEIPLKNVDTHSNKEIANA
ncbi:PAS domain-containing sensor histidine kinase [Flavitalea sp.]|nr:PAS domain S-box protein [Flavitalea sp.]